jgi:hypothetical protein
VSRYIEELREAVQHMHGAEATHVESVPVKEVFQGKTVWDGVVEVFDLKGHPLTSRLYAWTHDTDDGKKAHIAVLHVLPVDSPLKAVQASIVQEYREANAAEA